MNTNTQDNELTWSRFIKLVNHSCDVNGTEFPESAHFEREEETRDIYYKKDGRTRVIRKKQFDEDSELRALLHTELRVLLDGETIPPELIDRLNELNEKLDVLRPLAQELNFELSLQRDLPKHFQLSRIPKSQRKKENELEASPPLDDVSHVNRGDNTEDFGRN